MAYENIRLKKKNFVVVDGYFWMMDNDTDSLIVKTDDGTQAYSYPLDTTLTEEVVSLEYDGHYIWSLENPSGTNVTIRKWYLDNYVCKLVTTFSLTGNASHSYDSDAFTIEHYHLTLTGNELVGQSNLSISDGSMLVDGMDVVIGPNSSGDVEVFSIDSHGADYIIIDGTLTKNYSSGDPVTFTKNIWLFNNYNGTDSSTGALYKFNAHLASFQQKWPGGSFKDVLACTFTDVSGGSMTGDESIAYIKTTNMIFLDPDDLDNSFGSMTMDNIEDDQATIIPIYDVTIFGLNVYRLQQKATYYGVTEIFSDGPYNYQLSTMAPFITSISIRANPAILPADGVSTSVVTAIVKDQFNLPISGKNVSFTDDDTNGFVSPLVVATNSSGVANTTYTAGIESREVMLTATAQQG